MAKVCSWVLMASKESGDAPGKRPLIAWAKAAFATVGQWYG
jgi:hypothetical protein